MGGFMDAINRHFEYERKQIEEKRELQRVCKHDGDKYTECTDFHRRDYGTFCKECKKLLHDNG